MMWQCIQMLLFVYPSKNNINTSQRGRKPGKRLSDILTSVLILAGTLANSGDAANVVSCSTACISGADASAHRRLFSALNSISNSCNT